MESQTPLNTQSSSSSSNRNLIIGIIVAILLCCCLVVLAIGGYFGWKAYQAAKSTVDQIQNIATSIPPIDPNNPSNPFPDSTNLPQGGLTDTSTRVTAWATAQIVASISGSGCKAPTPEGTVITVTQQPDSSGVWKEKWDLSCGDGTTKSVNITFTPENGTVSVNVEIP